KGNHWVADGASIFRTTEILFKDAKGEERPSRVYVGDSYKGGYSDHLPVYLTLTPVK
ncbi:MAG: endonuclease, partial [Flavobacteriales bacterium]|nr:endonuclease [Flavobacteriales bacterium]